MSSGGDILLDELSEHERATVMQRLRELGETTIENVGPTDE